MNDLINREIPGIVLPEKKEDETDHIKTRGRYKVYIPTFMQHHGLESVIWCKNHIHKYRYGINESSEEEKLIYGEYKPIQIGSRVIVKFFSNNLSSGYIDRLITDYEDKCLPFKADHTDQNDIYVILRTAKHHNLVAFLEDTETEDLPKNSFHLYYDEDQVRIIMNEDGMYTWVTKDKFTRILQNNTVWIEEDNKHFIDGNNRYLIQGNNIVCIKGTNKTIIHDLSEHIYKKSKHEQIDENHQFKIKNDRTIEIHGNEDITVKKNKEQLIEEDYKTEVKGDGDILVDGVLNIKGSPIRLNCD